METQLWFAFSSLSTFLFPSVEVDWVCFWEPQWTLSHAGPSTSGYYHMLTRYRWFFVSVFNQSIKQAIDQSMLIRLNILQQVYLYLWLALTEHAGCCWLCKQSTTNMHHIDSSLCLYEPTFCHRVIENTYQKLNGPLYILYTYIQPFPWSYIYIYIGYTMYELHETCTRHQSFYSNDFNRLMPAACLTRKVLCTRT